jgi:hypothetical protein
MAPPWPIATMSRGRFIVREGKLVGDKRYGRDVSRARPFDPSFAQAHSMTDCRSAEPDLLKTADDAAAAAMDSTSAVA